MDYSVELLNDMPIVLLAELYSNSTSGLVIEDGRIVDVITN